MRADRLLSLLLLLQARGRMTARELAERLEVSERTIYRDLDALSAAGVPIYTERGPGGGCELLNGYQTKLTGLTEMEVRALFLLGVSHPLTDLGLDHALEDALLKLSAALPSASRADATQVRQRIHLDTSLPSHNGEALLHLQTIQQALWLDRRLRLTSTHQCEQRVDPYGLVSKAGIWYLVGAFSGEMRVLRVSRIQAVQMTEERFSRPEDFDLATYWIKHNASFQTKRPRNVRTKRNFPDHPVGTSHVQSGLGRQRKKRISNSNHQQKKPIYIAHQPLFTRRHERSDSKKSQVGTRLQLSAKQKKEILFIAQFFTKKKNCFIRSFK